MITVSEIHDLVSGRKKFPPVACAWTGATVEELAPAGAVACIVNGAVVKAGSVEWRNIPPDGSALCYIVAEGAATAIGLSITALSVFGQISAGTATWVTLATAAVSAALTTAMYFFGGAAGEPSGGGGGGSSPTYGFDGIPNTIENGRPIPVVYGEHDVGGQYLMAMRQLDGSRAERIKLLLAVSEGPIEAIGNYDSAACIAAGGNANGVDRLTGADIPENIRINGLDARTLDKCEVSIRLGGDTQTPCFGFGRVVQEFEQSNYELDGVRSFEWDTRGPVNVINVLLSLPAGIYKSDKNGKIVRLEEPPEIRVRVYNQDGTTLVQTKTVTFNKKRTTPVFGQITIENLDTAKYHVVVDRTAMIPPAYTKFKLGRKYEDHCYVTSIQEQTYGAPGYAGVALIAIDIQATNQLSGRIQKIVSRIQGRTLQSSDGAAWSGTEAYSTNPAYVAADMFTHPRYGLGNKVAHADLPAAEWKDYADFCDELVDLYTGAAASVGDVVADSDNESDPVITPTITGTYNGSVSGYMKLRIESKTATTATIRRYFYPSDGSATVETNCVFSGVGPTSIAYGLSVTLDDDPAAGTTDPAFNVGDQWRFTVSAAGQQKRFEFNGVFDSAGAAWEQALRVGGMSRAMFLKAGNQILPTLLKDKPASMMFTAGNTIEKTSRVAWLNPDETPNAIRLTIKNAANNFNDAPTVAAIPGLDEGSGDLNLRDMGMIIGVTDIYQARRLAFFHLRAARAHVKTLELEAGVEAIAVQPGDVFLHQDAAPGWCHGGRVVGLSAGNIQLDQSIAFTAGKVYTYLERDLAGPSGGDNDPIDTQDFIASTTTDVLPFAPLFGGSGTGRTYIVGEKSIAEQKFLCQSVSWANGGFGRRVSGVVFEPSVFTDAAEDFDATSFIETPGALPPLATNLAVVETSTEPGVSHLTLTWDAAAGAQGYDVFWTESGDDDFQYGGYTESTTFEHDSELPSGHVLVYAVVTVMPDEQRTLVEAAPTVEHTIARVDDGTDLIDYPDSITLSTVALNVDAGNVYDLDWTDVADRDSYIVSIGTWFGRAEIQDSVTNTCSVVRPRVERRYSIRAVNTTPPPGYYAEREAYIIAAAVAHASYPTLVDGGVLIS